jgi:hypothetical protein
MSGYYTNETYTYNVEQSNTDFSGFDDITICRPKLIYFKVTGLRPNTRHFAFLDNVNVTNYVNTSVATISDFKNLGRNDIRRNPGEKYVNETGFPTELGGPTGSIFSNSEGKIEGVFYLQSNASLNFPAGVRKLAFIDISQLNPEAALSYANGVYAANGGIENYTVNYYSVQKTGTRQVWVDTPDNDGPDNDGGNGNSPGTTGNTYLGPSHYETRSDGSKYGVGARYGKGDPAADVEMDDRAANTADGGGCCFILLESRYGNGTMDEVVRRYRDEYMTDRNRRGYYKLAEVFVPLMRKYPVFKWLVTKTMADPLVAYGKYYYGQTKYGIIFSPVKNFWMALFDILGGETEFIRENGEVI